jgi:hypothetical protein
MTHPSTHQHSPVLMVKQYAKKNCVLGNAMQHWCHDLRLTDEISLGNAANGGIHKCREFGVIHASRTSRLAPVLPRRAFADHCSKP